MIVSVSGSRHTSQGYPPIFDSQSWVDVPSPALSGVSSLSFESLGLRAELLRAIHEQGYLHPTPIQKEAIPAIIDGQDVLAAAQTGTGKTAGFTLPLLQRLAKIRFHA